MRYLLFFVCFCVSCSWQQAFDPNPHREEGARPEPLSFRLKGSYSTHSFVLSFLKSSVFEGLLSQKEQSLLSMVGLIFGDKITDSIKRSLHLKYDQALAYTISYNVPSPYGPDWLEASGLLIVPNSKEPLPLLIYFHPTLLHKNFAPSVIASSAFSMDPITDYRLMMIFLALQGYIVLAPDYIGYGTSKDSIPPYLHKESVVKSASALLAVAQTALDKQNLTFYKDLFIMGYSQGGHSALAFAEFLQNKQAEFNGRGNSNEQRDLNGQGEFNNQSDFKEQRNSNGWNGLNSLGDFKVRAVSAGGGPYDLFYTVREQLQQNKVWRELTALLLQSYSAIYNWDLDSIVKKPRYADTIYYTHTIEDLSKAVRDLPDRTSSLFRSDFIRSFREGDKPYQKFLEQNSVYNWRPESPILLFHHKEDSIVPYANLERTYRAFRSWRSVAPIQKKKCSFKKIEDLAKDIKEWGGFNKEQPFKIDPNHINCGFIHFLETSEYFRKH